MSERVDTFSAPPGPGGGDLPFVWFPLTHREEAMEKDTDAPYRLTVHDDDKAYGTQSEFLFRIPIEISSSGLQPPPQ